jgi:hypothetical protein
MVLSRAPTRLVSFENGAASPSATNAMAAGDFQSSQRSQIGAQVVPAKLQVRPTEIPTGARGSVSVVAQSAVKSSFKAENKPDFIPAHVVQRRAIAPMLVRASTAGDGVDPQPLFLVMQTEVVQTRQYDATGAVVWDLCVWRVTVVGTMQSKMEAGIAAKSI